MRSIPVQRNTLVLGITLFTLAGFAWAGWANWEYRRQAAEVRAASSMQGELVATPDNGPAQLLSPLINKPAPAFALEDLSGKKVTLASYKGKAVLINFWATWCAPCKIETPWIVELREKYAAQGFEVLGISADDLDLSDKEKLAREKQQIAHSAQQLRISYPVLVDGDSLSKSYGGLDELPTSFFVNRDGTIVAAQLGLTSKDDIEAHIKLALGEGK